MSLFNTRAFNTRICNMASRSPSMSISSTRRELTSGRVAVAVGLMMALGAAPGWAAVVSGSTGADGALSPTVNTEIQLPPSGVLNYTTVNIPSGVTVKFKRNAANTPVYMLATGDVTIAGTIDIRGTDAKPTGTYGDGALGDDGVPGVGGPGGYDGGRGGREDAAQRGDVIRGGSGIGPGGGPGGVEGADGCTASTGFYKANGVGGGYSANAYSYGVRYQCSNPDAIPWIGKAYGSALLQPLIGGSGGGGGRGGTSYPGSGGGGGGGAILIASSGTLRVTGSITTEGGDGGGLSGTGAGAQGAGGSGGAIRLMANTIAGAGSVLANGGCRNSSNNRRQDCGSDGYWQLGGAPGRIRFEADAITFSGTQQPTASTDLPGPIFIADTPTLRITSVAGQTVPANPIGNADITLPAGSTGSVISFETTNVPTGNTVRLRVVPAYGQPIEVLSPAITGSTAAGMASVTVTLPAGPSTLQATTTYTVVVAGDIDLSRFAQNEVVEKVEVTVPMVGAAQARLITRTGKSFGVPYEALRAAGFRG
jgi:hypothetical protein